MTDKGRPAVMIDHAAELLEEELMRVWQNYTGDGVLTKSELVSYQTLQSATELVMTTATAQRQALSMMRGGTGVKRTELPMPRAAEEALRKAGLLERYDREPMVFEQCVDDAAMYGTYPKK